MQAVTVRGAEPSCVYSRDSREEGEKIESSCMAHVRGEEEMVGSHGLCAAVEAAVRPCARGAPTEPASSTSASVGISSPPNPAILHPPILTPTLTSSVARARSHTVVPFPDLSDSTVVADLHSSYTP